MAGDWMKIELELPDKPEVHYIAGVLNLDPDAVVGKLIRVWQWFNKHTENGNAVGVTFALPDRITGVTGFGEAMQFAGWLIQSGSTLTMPKFDRHTSESAKTRANAASRQNKFRNKSQESNANSNASTVTEPSQREEKNKDITQDKPAAKRGTQVPKDFSPNETSILRAKELGVDWKAELPKFIDHHSNKGTVGKDWDAGFRTWLANSIKFGTAVKTSVTDPQAAWRAAMC